MKVVIALFESFKAKFALGIGYATALNLVHQHTGAYYRLLLRVEHLPAEGKLRPGP
jgi:hypothetical protein